MPSTDQGGRSDRELLRQTQRLKAHRQVERQDEPQLPSDDLRSGSDNQCAVILNKP